MDDPRIAKLLEATEAMKNGSFDVKFPSEGTDQIGKLGVMLNQLRDSVRENIKQITALGEVTEQINQGLTLDEVLNHVYDSCRDMIPYDRIGFALIDTDGETVRAHWARSELGTMLITKDYSAALTGSTLQGIIETGQPRILNDLEAYLRDHPKSESTQKIVEEGIKSSLTCPLVALGKPIGFMFFSSAQTNTYQNAHVETFLQIAGQLAIIVEKSRLYERLSELNELKNKFVGIAAHDLRNPISVINGYVDLFLLGLLGELTDQQKNFVKKMKKSCVSMIHLVGDFLDISAIESGKLELRNEEVDLSEFLHESFETNSLLAKSKSIRLEIDIEPNLPKIVFDPNRIDQVINNLLGNAIKFSYPDSRVKLKARSLGEFVEIAVQDWGKGIPEQEQSSVFAEFTQTSVRPTGDEKGSGLGLAIVKRIVEKHGGEVYLASKPGKGSTFFFTLPMKSGT